MIRIGFRGIVYYNYNKEPRQQTKKSVCVYIYIYNIKKTTKTPTLDQTTVWIDSWCASGGPRVPDKGDFQGFSSKKEVLLFHGSDELEALPCN